MKKFIKKYEKIIFSIFLIIVFIYFIACIGDIVNKNDLYFTYEVVKPLHWWNLFNLLDLFI